MKLRLAHSDFVELLLFELKTPKAAQDIDLTDYTLWNYDFTFT